MPDFAPNLSRLSAAQRAKWPAFRDLPESFALYGGTGLSVRYGHRASHDFDFFGTEPFDPDELLASLPFSGRAEVIQREANTLTVRDEGVLASFFGLHRLGRVAPPELADGVPVASTLDVAGMKVSVIQKRASARDYADIDAILASGVTLDEALAAAGVIYGPAFAPLISVKALSNFSVGDLAELPAAVRARLASAATDAALDRYADNVAALCRTAVRAAS